MSVIVVAAAIVRDGLVLGAHRHDPGGWEFPGGKVEPGETEADALIRECAEELGVVIERGEFVAEQAIDEILVLRLYLAEVVTGEPVALSDHDELRWVSVAELASLDWLPADLPLVSALQEHWARY